MRLYTVVLAVRPAQADGADIPGHEFLMVRNRKRGKRWELPGGRGEAGEDGLQCARREFLEETGFELKAPALLLRRTTDLGDGHVFLGAVGPQRGRPMEDEIDEIAWFPRLPPRDELSFPNDPYRETFSAARAVLAARTANGPADP